MSFAIVNRPAVYIDIIEAIDYYKNINPKLAKQFLFRIQEAKTYLVNNPLSFEIKYREVRTLIVKQFPYQIHYLVDNELNRIVILAIVHSYKNPLDYSSR